MSDKETAKETVDILFFGDLVGKPGRQAVKAYLDAQPLSAKPDVIIANGENVSHGFGLSEKNFRELMDCGIQVLTSGNHIWDRKEIFDYIYSTEALLRPDNFPAEMPGTGARVFQFNGFKIGVINLIGQVFMGNYNSPWERLDALVPQIQYETPIIFLDFHAEATAEKVSMGRYASQLGVSAMVGTHTHVQTGDERILNNRMGYITDAGFNGSYESVIGFEPQAAIQRLKSHIPSRLEVGGMEQLQINAIRFTIEAKTGICRKLERINQVMTLSEKALAEIEA
ncbi:MAG: YmdB family metallophosphoesterase [Cyanobacteria bacterium]|nr:YmdB family metallophosphoesterase [Cyanobacteriota bacterium]